MKLIDDVAAFIGDLLGCTEEDLVCKAKAKKYATWLILVGVIVIIAFFAPKIYWLFKRK